MLAIIILAAGEYVVMSPATTTVDVFSFRLAQQYKHRVNISGFLLTFNIIYFFVEDGKETRNIVQNTT